MRLLGVPRLPLPQFVPRASLTRNCPGGPGPAISFCPSVPLSYASSLVFPPAPSPTVSSFLLDSPLSLLMLSLFLFSERPSPFEMNLS
jgi:hypothetical protein